MTVLLDRWQFGVTILYHFLFVPLTIGLGLLVAVMQTLAYRRQDAEWERLTRFFGRLFLINFAMGVVTGIVQEFQFGMNWSEYSIFVGNIFGAPLAMEGLLAFFMESTFLGLWIFGRDRLSPRLHLASIWFASMGTILSAFFILAANSWMQHPVGYRIVDHKAELTSIWKVLGNPNLWQEFPHTLLAAFTTGGMVLLGVSTWKLLHGEDRPAFTRAARLAAAFTLAAVLATMFTGDQQGRLLVKEEPMKMAAAEALYNTGDGASFSLLTIGNLADQPVFQIRVPHLLSLIEDMSWNGKVEGIDQVQAAEAARYGPGSYVPIVWVTYWSFRLMIGLGALIMVVSAGALWLTRRGRLGRHHRWFAWVAVGSMAAPFLANSFGWLFTEMGRQPWIVTGLMKTSQAISPSVGATSVAITLGCFVALYSALAVVDVTLMGKSVRRPLDEAEGGAGDDGDPAESHPALVY